MPNTLVSGHTQGSDTAWSVAIAAALRGCPEQPGGLHLFYEAREDLSAEIDREGLLSQTASRSEGLTARGPLPAMPMAYRGNPQPEDAPDLVRQVASDPPQIASRRPGGAEQETPPVLDGEIARRVLREAMDGLSRVSGLIEPRAGWVEFTQRVVVGRPSSPVLCDVRRGRRLQLSGGSAAGRITAEAALRPLDDAALLVAALVGRLSQGWARRREARPAPRGAWPVVFAPGVGGILIHEIVGHALEADTVEAGLSWLGRMEGKVAGPDLTVLDDPRRSRAAWQHDDEGQSVRPVALIRNGCVAAFLHDQASARGEECLMSGHGRRATYRDPVRPRMGCTFVAAGSSKHEEVVASVARGLYVRRMDAAATATITGRAVFRVAEADWIEAGGLREALLPFVLEVDGRSALATLDLIADDLIFDACLGACARDGQALVTSVGAPTFRIGLANVLL